MKKLSRIMLAAGILAAAGGLARAEELTIGAILPLSGSSATQGDDQRRGIELAVEKVNAEGGVLGKTLKVMVEDSGGRPQGALDVAQKLVTINNVPIVLGEYSSGVTIPMAEYVLKQGRIHLNIGSSSGRLRKLGKGSFSLIGLDGVSAAFAAKDVKELGYKTVATIFPNNAYGQGVASEFKKAFEAAGGTNAIEILYTEGQTSYRRELQQMERAKPDAYVYSAYGKEAAIINREAVELGLNATPWYGLYLSMCTADTDPQIAKGQIGMEVNTIGPNGQFYENAYKAKYNETFRSTFSGFAYDGVILAARAINQVGGTDPDKLRDAIAEIGKSFEGATGTIVFDADGQRTEQPYLKVRFDETIKPR